MDEYPEEMKERTKKRVLNHAKALKRKRAINLAIIVLLSTISICAALYELVLPILQQ